MTRRGLIGALLGAATMDPERLLWVPGAKIISIPKPVVASGNYFITPEEVSAMWLDALKYHLAQNPIPTMHWNGDTMQLYKPARFRA